MRFNRKEDLCYDPKKDKPFMLCFASFWYFKADQLGLVHARRGKRERHGPVQQFKTFFSELRKRAKAEGRCVCWDGVKDWQRSS